MSDLALGTAQWGHGYGATNRRGRLGDSDLVAIMAVADAAGITSVDTASGYGDAQARLRPWAAGVTVTTKVAGIEPAGIRSQLVGSLTELGLGSVDACLLHDWDVLDAPTRARAARVLEDCRDSGLVHRVGVSAYDVPAVADAAAAFGDLGQAQVPANAVDRRLDDSKVLTELAASGVRIQVRSAFLQGVLLDPTAGPLGTHPAVETFHAWCRESGRTPLQGALAHVRSLGWAGEIVVGVTSAAELRAIVSAWGAVPAAAAPADLASNDLDLLDPRRWEPPL